MDFSLAVISDIHGNRFALEAVVDEIRRRKISRVINLGDTFYGPLDIQGTYACLQAYSGDWIHICGNGDRIVLSAENAHSANATVRYSRHMLTDGIKDFLSALPFSYCDNRIYACHGTPDSDERYLLEEMCESGGCLRPTGKIAADIAGIEQEIVLCGHSHLSRTLCIPKTGQLVINPGSVGLPAYADELPVAHRMEAGSPLAQFAVLHRQGSSPGPAKEQPGRQIRAVNAGWTVEQVFLPYDHEAAAALARKNGRPDWAHALLTGRVSDGE